MLQMNGELMERKGETEKANVERNTLGNQLHNQGCVEIRGESAYLKTGAHGSYSTYFTLIKGPEYHRY